MALEFVDVEKVDMGRGLLLVFGRSGVGKTTFVAASAAIPELSPVLHVSLDKSHDSVTNPGFRHLLADENGVMPVLKWDVAVPGTVKDIDRLLNGLNKGSIVYRATGEPYKTIIWDNLTMLQQKVFFDRRGGANNLTIEGQVPVWEDYNYSQHGILAMLGICRDYLSQQMIATCGQRGARPRKIPQVDTAGMPMVDGAGQPVLVQQKPDEAVGFGLNLASTVAELVPQFFSIVGRMYYRKNGERVFDTRPNALCEILKDGTYTIGDTDRQKKTRVKGVIFDPTMIELWDCISPVWHQANSDLEETVTPITQ
jgi:hypothetical protein